jgi:hypothetical protein
MEYGGSTHSCGVSGWRSSMSKPMQLFSTADFSLTCRSDQSYKIEIIDED